MLNKDIIEKVLNIAIHAGNIVKKCQQGDFFITRKKDKSLVTDADQESNRYIINNLPHVTDKHIPIISEENDIKNNKKILKDSTIYWLVDPLDGTKAFAKRKDEYTVNIALIDKGKPILGVIYIPAKENLFYAEANKGAFKKNAQGKVTRLQPNTQTKGILTSRRGDNNKAAPLIALLKQHGFTDMVKISSAQKFCMMAEGEASVYINFCPTFIWDSAAGHVIVQEAGCTILNTNEIDIVYDLYFENPDFLVINNKYLTDIVQLLRQCNGV